MPKAIKDNIFLKYNLLCKKKQAHSWNSHTLPMTSKQYYGKSWKKILWKNMNECCRNEKKRKENSLGTKRIGINTCFFLNGDNEGKL